MSAISQHKVCILSAETGSGKSVGTTHMLLKEANSTNKPVLILVGVPQRIGAQKAQTSLQHFYRNDDTIGYHIQNDSNTTRDTALVFMTHGVLLQHLKNMFVTRNTRVTHVFIDEAHEMNADAEACMQFLKLLMNELPVKIIIMSATLQSNELSKFFDESNTVQIFVPGTIQNLTIFHQEDFFLNDINDVNMENNSDNIDLISYEKISQVVYHCDSFERRKSASILIFLPGMQEIRKCEEFIKTDERYRSFNFAYLHGDILHNTGKVFDIDSQNFSKRTIFLATNIAETSITLMGITFVIDTGYEKVVSYDPITDAQIFSLQRITKSSAIQRAGRTGRLGEGFVYRLYTKQEFDSFPSNKSAAVNVMDISPLLLNLMSTHDSIDAKKFLTNLLHPAEQDRIDSTIRTLTKLELIEWSDVFEKHKITNFGKWVNRIPVNIYESIAIIYGITFKYLDAILSITFAATDKDLFEITGKAKDKNAIENAKL